VKVFYYPGAWMTRVGIARVLLEWVRRGGYGVKGRTQNKYLRYFVRFSRSSFIKCYYNFMLIQNEIKCDPTATMECVIVAYLFRSVRGGCEEREDVPAHVPQLGTRTPQGGFEGRFPPTFYSWAPFR
jgi:hypothetical protein